MLSRIPRNAVTRNAREDAVGVNAVGARDSHRQPASKQPFVATAIQNLQRIRAGARSEPQLLR